MGPPGKNGPQGLKVSRTVKNILKVSLNERIIYSVLSTGERRNKRLSRSKRDAWSSSELIKC